MSEQIQQNNKKPIVICYHSATYSFTNKPEIGGWELTKPITANSYARQPALINRLVYMSLYSYAKVSSLSHATYTVGLKNCLLALYVMQRLAIASFVSLPAPPFQLFRKVRLITLVAYSRV